jgi:exopolysaccharide biosynthesis WecB/TagA/CpsF family protein
LRCRICHCLQKRPIYLNFCSLRPSYSAQDAKGKIAAILVIPDELYMNEVTTKPLAVNATPSQCGADDLPLRPLLGIPVAVATAGQAIGCLDARLQEHLPTCVAFFNANTSNVAASQPRLSAVLQKFIVFCDGIGADIASWALHGSAFPENLNGTDFVPLFLRRTRHALRIFVLGGHPHVTPRAVEEFRRQAPQHTYVGFHHGYFTAEELPEILDAIRQLKSDVILVALGTPLQELWLADHFAATGCRLGFAVGGLLDFVSGTKPRAPLWVRRIRMEWMYRLLLEPRRMWRRYIIGNVRFLVRVGLALVKNRKQQI